MAVSAPSSFPSQLVQIQWVSATLKKLEAVRRTQQSPLTVQHPLVSPVLQGLCSHTHYQVTSCCKVLLTACAEEWLTHQDLLSVLVSQVVTAEVYMPILAAVSELLVQEMSAIVESCSVYISPYSLQTSMHPFISILNSRPEAGRSVLYHVTEILRSRDLAESSVQLVEPVIKQLLLHPSSPLDFVSLATQLYSDLIALARTSPETAGHLLELLVRVLPLCPVRGASELLWIQSAIAQLTPLHLSLTTQYRDNLIEFSFQLCMELSSKGLPLLPSLQSLSSLLLLKASGTSCLKPHHVLALGWLLLHQLSSPHTTASLLALGAALCPSLPSHFSSLLILPLIQLLSLPPSTLHLLRHDHTHLENQHVAASLLKQLEVDCMSGGRQGVLEPSLPSTTCPGVLAGMCGSMQEYLCVVSDSTQLPAWLDTVAGTEKASEQGYLALVLAGTALCCSDQPHTLKSVLTAFGRLVKHTPSLTPSVLPFLLYLNKSIPDPDSKLQLFHSIPALCTHPACANSVLGVLWLLGTSPSLLPLATHLMGRAWHQQHHLFPHVKEMLTRPLPSSLSPQALREIQVARVAVIRDICRNGAEQHGEEMLSLISRTLTSSYQDALQVAMATEGVVLLCEHEVVDVVTVWGVLGREGRLASDNRPGVVVAVTKLLALASDLDDDETSHSHKVFKNTALQYLWKHAFSQNVSVSLAALKALTDFKLADFSSEHLPSQVVSLLKSHDLDPIFPLTGHHCVLLSGCVPPGALSAYSAFLGSLVEVEIGGVSRGAVHSALKQAMLVSPHETALHTKATSLRERQFTASQLGDGLIKFCALTGIQGSPPPPPPDLSGAQVAAWRRELNAALDKKLTTLRTLLSSSAGLWVGLRGGALWEGLVAMYSSRRWEVLRDICQYFYQIRLSAVNFDPSTQSSQQQQQAYEWALSQVLKCLQQSVRDNAASVSCVFMALVGVASFPYVTTDQSDAAEKGVEHADTCGSLLLDLLTASLSILSGDHVISGQSHVTYTHDVVKLVVERGVNELPELPEAVTLLLPLLFSAVSEHWGPATPPNVQAILSSLLSALYDTFNSEPNWYTAIVLNQLFLRGFPANRQLSVLFHQLLPFLKASTESVSVELLSLTAAFIPTLLARGYQQLATNMLAALQQLLTGLDTSLFSSQPAQLCMLHLSHTLCDLFAVWLLTAEECMVGVTQLATIATATPSEAVVQWSLGLLLHGLSARGHTAARELAESVGTKWLSEVTTSDLTQQVVAVMMGLAGLVGVGPVRGVVREGVACAAPHSEMILALSYLIAETMDKLKDHEDATVRTISTWLASQVTTDTSDRLATRERVPKDYSYLPSATSLPSILHTCQALVARGVKEDAVPMLMCLLTALTRHTSHLPPADYSSLLLPVMWGCGQTLQGACLNCLVRSKEGHGFKQLLLWCTSPHVFVSLPRDCQQILLENLCVWACCLHSSQRLVGFLCEMTVTISSSLPSPSLLTSYIRGLRRALSEEGVGVGVESTLRSGLHILYRQVCDTVSLCIPEDMQEVKEKERAKGKVTPSDLVALLSNTSVWKEMAPCLTVPLSPTQHCPYVDIAVRCSQLAGGLQPFKTLSPALDWLLETLPAALQEDGSRKIFSAPFCSILKTISFCCCEDNDKASLHQTELLHMLSAYVRKKPGSSLSEDQWRAVLLYALTGCGVTSPQDCTSHDVDLRHTLSYLLSQLHMCSLPSPSATREKLMVCLLEWYEQADSQLVKNSILGYFCLLKDCEQYRKNIIWSTVAHLI